MLQARVAAALKIGALIVKIVVLLQRTLRMTPDAGMKHQHHSGLLTEKNVQSVLEEQNLQMQAHLAPLEKVLFWVFLVQ